jgi:DNA polymerase II small subunit
MSEKSVAAIKCIVAAGYQLDKSCLELLRLIEDKVDLARLAAEVLNEASKAKLWPPVIDRLLLEKVALRISPDKTIGAEKVLPTVVSTTIPYAKEVQARIEILDKELEKRSKAEIGDFARYFRTRFRKIQEILNERLDVRGAGTIGQALEASPNEKVRFIAMIMDKRPRKDYLFLSVDDEENSATVMVQRSNPEAFETAQSAPLDQVVYVEAVRAKKDLLICEKLYLPDLPDHEPHRADEPVFAALLSDIHVGSNTFLREAFGRMILWLNGKIGTPNQRDVAGRIKYLVIAGDLVDGVGIYPDQDRELEIPDVYAQYKVAAQYVKQIPDYIEVILIPGNHDATRQAIPQPAVAKEFAEPVYEARSIHALDNPVRLRLHGVSFLVYHGRSLDDVVATVPGMTFQTPDKAMEHLLRCRHLAPEYGKRTPVAPEQEDRLVIQDVPDVFHSGHIHVLKHKEYRRTVIVNSGAWQSQTEYQRKMGLVPTPGILPTLSLQTLQVGLIDFTQP